MERSFIDRLQLTLLAVVTAGLVLLAGLNFWQERHSQQPDDGVWWREAADGSGLVADKVLPNSPGQRAGIRSMTCLPASSSRLKAPASAAAFRSSRCLTKPTRPPKARSPRRSGQRPA
jgi:hypothetical protein